MLTLKTSAMRMTRSAPGLTFPPFRSLEAQKRSIDTQITAEIDALADAGVSWPVIAEILGVSRQAARQAHTRRQTPASAARLTA